MNNDKAYDNDLYQWLAGETELVQAQKLIITSRNTFQQYIYAAENAFLDSEWEKAVRIVQEAGHFAFYHHPGMFFSCEAERILRECARNLDKICNVIVENSFKKTAGRRHVLHVLTEGYAWGGHTRLAARWMENDTESVHAAIAVASGSTMPNWLPEAAKRSGGWYLSFTKDKQSLCQSAKLLREIAYLWADIVVLHHHPYDVIPAIAFGIDGGPPVVLLNHSDHTFGFGVSAADMVADLRPAGQELTMKRRGTNKSMILPIPLAETASQYTRALARDKLGLNEHTMLLLSIASAYKFLTCGRINMFHTLNRIIQNHNNVVIVVIGPSDQGNWRQLREQTGGRVRAIGMQEDLALFYQAADVYLDSFLIGSLTASLDAGLNGLPVVYLNSNVAKTLRLNDISFLESKVLYTPLQNFSYEEQAGQLIHEASLRRTLGDNLSHLITKHHIAGWNEYLEAIYQALPAAHTALDRYTAFGEWAEDDLVWAYSQYLAAKEYNWGGK